MLGNKGLRKEKLRKEGPSKEKLRLKRYLEKRSCKEKLHKEVSKIEKLQKVGQEKENLFEERFRM